MTVTKKAIVLTLLFIVFPMVFLGVLAFNSDANAWFVGNVLTPISSGVAGAWSGFIAGVTGNPFWVSYVAPNIVLITFVLTSMFWVVMFWRRTSIKNRTMKTLHIAPKQATVYQQQPVSQPPQVIPQAKPQPLIIEEEKKVEPTQPA